MFSKRHDVIGQGFCVPGDDLGAAFQESPCRHGTQRLGVIGLKIIVIPR